jgi:hypothetical protein
MTAGIFKGLLTYEAQSTCNINHASSLALTHARTHPRAHTHTREHTRARTHTHTYTRTRTHYILHKRTGLKITVTIDNRRNCMQIVNIICNHIVIV